ncbi:hypothetical protein BD311DRAFT_744819 [Dichomitus squalens]|uniref:Uncharacterized protein n=1 Tax=Dichomitus squalens TaxID=114155 RepID=A0A4Q9N948_9APHY|nr:hypothetical protein BD311DRAFT_744819 [Dichomitus squalens]
MRSRRGATLVGQTAVTVHRHCWQAIPIFCRYKWTVNPVQRYLPYVIQSVIKFDGKRRHLLFVDHSGTHIAL